MQQTKDSSLEADRNQKGVILLAFVESGEASPEALLAPLRAGAGASFEATILPPPHDSRTLNQAIKLHAQKDIVLVNPILQIKTKDWLLKFQALAAQTSQLGVIGVKIFDRAGLIYSCGRSIVSRFGLTEHLALIGHGESDAEDFQQFREVDTVLPWLCYIRREAYDQAGGFDEQFMAVSSRAGWPPWLEQDDFCLSVRAAGFTVGVEPSIEAFHPQAAQDAHFTALYENRTVPPLVIYDERVANLWRKKWRWHPTHPDLNAVRERWIDSKICWRIGKRLLDTLEVEAPLVDLLLVTRDNLSVLQQTLACLRQTSYRPLRFWIHVNGSSDGTANYLQELAKDFPFPLHFIEVPVNLGYTPAFNWLLHLSDAPLVAKLDDDIEVSAGWLNQLAERLRAYPYAAAVGAKIVQMEDFKKILWADYRVNPRPVTHADEQDEGQFDYLSRTVGNMGCCLLYRRRAIDLVGPFDISLNPVSWDDLDHQIALWAAGYDVLYDGKVVVKHPLKPWRDQCRRAMKNTCGNGYKVQIKWGSGSLAILDQSLEAGRHLD